MPKFLDQPVWSGRGQDSAYPPAGGVEYHRTTAGNWEKLPEIGVTFIIGGITLNDVERPDGGIYIGSGTYTHHEELFVRGYFAELTSGALTWERVDGMDEIAFKAKETVYSYTFAFDDVNLR